MKSRERAQRLRRLGVRGTIAAFVVAWAIIFGQLALGHDPALGGGHTAQKHKATTTSPSSGGSQSDDTGSSESQSQTQTPAPVTTGQS
jgi:hypothetical protein